MKFFHRLLLAILFITAVSACTPTNTSTETENPLENTEWVLESFGPAGAEVPVIEEGELTLTFKAAEEASGFGGCNVFTTSYEVQDNSIDFGETISTQVACTEESITDQEDKYFSALRSAEEFEQMGDRLVVHYIDENGEGHLNFGVDTES